ncbi:MAG: hypothetical protein FWC24_06575 [Treponema sp.]|nr:hypothetical protein [Treponema sp.]
MALFLQKTRRVLRKVFLFAGVAAVALLFQACYGPAPAYDYEWENETTKIEDESSKEDVDKDTDKEPPNDETI